jgi:hypothetical protein
MSLTVKFSNYTQLREFARLEENASVLCGYIAPVLFYSLWILLERESKLQKFRTPHWMVLLLFLLQKQVQL